MMNIHSARKSIGRRAKNVFNSDSVAPVLKTKVQNVSVPPPLKSSLSSKEMDASFFVATWDLRGKSVCEAKDPNNLLPRGFDIYVVGLQNCRSITEVSDVCQDFLQKFGNYKEFSHLMTGDGGKLKTSLALLVLAREHLVSDGNLSMNRVDCVRDRRLSALPYLMNSDSIALSTAENQKTLMRDLDANGGAVTMRFSFYDSHFLAICVKMNCIGELNEILARVEPEKHPHVFMFGDFGEDVIENTQELDQRLYLEEFNAIPSQFQNSRAIVVTRSRNRQMKKYMKANIHGHYDLIPKETPAAFSTFRLHGGAGTGAAHVAKNSISSRWTGNLSQFGEIPPPPSMDLRDSWVPPPPPDSSRNSTMSVYSAIPPPPPDSQRNSAASYIEGLIPPPPDSRRASAMSTFSAIPPPPQTPFEDTDSKSKRGSVRSTASEEEEQKRHSADSQESGKRNSFRRSFSKTKRSSVESSNDTAGLLRKAIQSLKTTLQPAASSEPKAPKEPSAYGVCRVCKEDILHEADSFHAMGDVYHKDCIRCSDCGELITSQFFMVNDKLLCQRSYEKLFDQRCAACGEAANPMDHLIKFENHSFHLDCFKCSTCDKELVELNDEMSEIVKSDFVRGEDGALFCVEHGAKHECTRCRKKVPAADGVQVCMGEAGDNVTFHKDCLTCEACDRSIFELDGQYCVHEDKIYCREDYNKLLDLFCAVCDAPLVVGELYVLNFGKKFHKQCYRCQVCGKEDLGSPVFSEDSDSRLACLACSKKN